MDKQLTVAVGLSGGVDSSMAAYLLKQQGFSVIGLTMKIWPGGELPNPRGKSGCYGPGEEHDLSTAAEICQRLGIPHHTIDLAREYQQTVLDDFSQQYLAGFTPNPCVLCNQFVKFGALLERARASGIHFDLFATGHYARLGFDSTSKRTLLRKAADLKKDQSYFLYRLRQEQLARSSFRWVNIPRRRLRKWR